MMNIGEFEKSYMHIVKKVKEMEQASSVPNLSYLTLYQMQEKWENGIKNLDMGELEEILTNGILKFLACYLKSISPEDVKQIHPNKIEYAANGIKYTQPQ